MPQVLTEYILTYGYLAIFCLVLLQETGVPGLPNELVLFCFGYLSREHHLVYPLVISLVVLADITGSFLLYLLFFYGTDWVFRVKPPWLPLPVKKIEAIKKKMGAGNTWKIFIGKLTPFVRGYVPVAAGMLRVAPLVYGKPILCTAVIWSGGWFTAGWLWGG